MHLHIFSDEIFFNVSCQLQAFDLNFVVNFAHTRVIDFTITSTVLNKSTNLESPKVMGRNRPCLTYSNNDTDSQNNKLL